VRTSQTWPLAWCKADERRYEQPVNNDYARCNTTSGYPGQQISTHSVSDGTYDCLDRSDEQPFLVAEESNATE
jgi:hypothetical protein